MKRNIKRFLTILLCVLLLDNMIPVTGVLASEDTELETVSAVSSDEGGSDASLMKPVEEIEETPEEEPGKALHASSDIDEDDSAGLDKSAAMGADDFSLDTEESASQDLQYILPGRKGVALSDILNAVGLTGEVTNAYSSAPNLFRPAFLNGRWIVASIQAFSGTEVLTVTVNDKDYEITITCDESGSSDYGLVDGIPVSDRGYIWMGADSPTRWHIIGEVNGRCLLISEDTLGGEMNREAAESYCEIVFSGFNAVEQAAVPPASKSEPEDYVYVSGYWFGPSSVNSNMFLLSAEEAETYFSSDAARLPGLWWLRSYFIEDGTPAVVYEDGRLEDSHVWSGDGFGARPAFQLNLESVLFSSAAEGGKSSAAAGSGEFGRFQDGAGSDRKLTLSDDSRIGFSANADNTVVSPGEKLAVNYSGVTSGDAVSAVICDASGSILYYASLTPDGSGSGIWNMTIPSGLANDSYTLKVFSEKQNGDKKTDYASPASEISMKVTAFYTVTFMDEDGETVLQSRKTAAGEMPEYEGETPTKADDAQNIYTFAGWDPEITEVTDDAVYKAIYTAETVPSKKGILIFDLTGGTLDGKTGKITIETNVGDVIRLPGVPSREGYTFLYWKGSEYEADAEYTVEGDHTFTAVWEENKARTYTVMFDANGHGTAPAALTVEESSKVSKPTDPAVSGYSFDGWFTDKECKNAFDFDTAVTKDITLYAKWVQNGAASGASAVKTGDESRAGSWLMLMMASLLGLVMIISGRKRIRR